MTSSNLHKKASAPQLQRKTSLKGEALLKKKKLPGVYNSKGTVMSLNPSSPLVCKSTSSIFEAAQRMIAAKENHALVIDDNGELLGIFTTKDLAFRVVGSNLNIKNTTVKKIMTPNPMCAKKGTKASEALNLMVLKQFRHLPIVNEENQVVGVLDITKCYNEAMKKLEKLYESSKKLYDAMETVNKELGNSGYGKQQHNYIITYFESLKKILSGPTLKQLINDESTMPVYCSIDSNVYDAAMLMKLKKTTAILVRDFNEEVVGIFTSKDVVSRVIGKGKDPNKCTVESVMTINPATSPSNVSINSALKQMFEGKYLNLPVIDEETNDIVGVVDVIRLTNFTLNQIQTMESFNEEDEDAEEDEYLFDSIGNNEFSSEKDFNKFLDAFDETPDGYSSDTSISIADVSVDEMAQFDLSTMSYDTNTSYSKNTSSGTNSRFGGGPHKKNSIISLGTVDYDEVCFFKFKVSRGRIHRVSYKPSEGLSKFKELLKEEFTKEELELFDNGQFEISYKDEDNDIIVINTDKDLKDCVLLMKSLQRNKVEIMLYDKHEVLVGKKGRLSTLNLRSRYNDKMTNTQSNRDIKDYLLPAALFTLSASIVVVFTLSRQK